MAPLQEFKRVHWVIPHFAEEYKNNMLSNNMSNQGLPVEAQFESTVPECASFVIQAWIWMFKTHYVEQGLSKRLNS